MFLESRAQVQLYTLAGSPSLDNVIVLELDMATMPTLQGQLTYFGLRTTAAAGALRLAIDRGDGQWRYGRCGTAGRISVPLRAVSLPS
jgi:hypothetical protein